MISSPQLSAATVLVQLLTEHPELPDAGWSIDSIVGELRGFVHTKTMADLVAYQDVIGGSVRAANAYEDRGQVKRRHLLNTVWRDVPVEIVVALPETATAVAS